MEWAADNVPDIDCEICGAGIGSQLLTCFFYQEARRSTREGRQEEARPARADNTAIKVSYE